MVMAGEPSDLLFGRYVMWAPFLNVVRKTPGLISVLFPPREAISKNSFAVACGSLLEIRRTLLLDPGVPYRPAERGPKRVSRERKLEPNCSLDESEYRPPRPPPISCAPFGTGARCQ